LGGRLGSKPVRSVFGNLVNMFISVRGSLHPRARVCADSRTPGKNADTRAWHNTRGPEEGHVAGFQRTRFAESSAYSEGNLFSSGIRVRSRQGILVRRLLPWSVLTEAR